MWEKPGHRPEVCAAQGARGERDRKRALLQERARRHARCGAGGTDRKCARPRGLRGGLSSGLRLREGSASGGGPLRPGWSALSPHGLCPRSAASGDGFSLSWPGGCGPCGCKPRRPRGHERQRRCVARAWGGGGAGWAWRSGSAVTVPQHAPGGPCGPTPSTARFLGSRAAFCATPALVHMFGGLCVAGEVGPCWVPGDEGDSLGCDTARAPFSSSFLSKDQEGSGRGSMTTSHITKGEKGRMPVCLRQ